MMRSRPPTCGYLPWRGRSHPRPLGCSRHLAPREPPTMADAVDPESQLGRHLASTMPYQISVMSWPHATHRADRYPLGSGRERAMLVQQTVVRTAGSELGRVGRHLRLAWPVFVVFLAQRLLTVAWVNHGAGELRPLVTRWDAGGYLRLAQGGYDYPNISPDGDVGASNLAYFPLFPWLVRRIGDSGLLSLSQALVVVSWLGGLLAVWAIFAVGNALYGRWAGIALSALWGMAPASLTLTMGYPEGMFTAAAAAALLCLIRRRPVWAGACAAVAGLLRPSAVAVIAMV